MAGKMGETTDLRMNRLILSVFLFLLLPLSQLKAQYNEKYRPLYHLSAMNSSMADPKGLFVYNGQYHIYWYGQWEHAVSSDLIHWKQFPKPMKGAPSQFSYFSGSVVVDKKNTSGFGKNSIVAIYTRHFPGDSLPETQAISVSNNGGFDFQYYEKNPVLDINKKSFRDPQVFWYEPGQKWKMVVALSDNHKILIYESGDLKEWQYCSTFGDLGATGASWECPDLIELPVVGTHDKKWVMIVGRGPNKVQYFVGDFDGKTFTPDTDLLAYLKNGKGLKGEVFDDFENGQLTKWKVEGSAFLTKENDKTAIDFLGSTYAGDLSKKGAVGTMKSQSFKINYKTINFLIAGGHNLDSLCVRLWVDGKVCRIATGDNTKVFKWSGWNVEDLIGKKANIEVIDLIKGTPIESIAIDHIIFSDNFLNLQTEHALWLDYGDDFYATRTYRNYDTNNNLNDSIILLSWLGNWKYHRIAPTSWGVGFQSVPRAIALKKFSEGIRLVQEPILALKSLRKDSVEFRNQTIKGIYQVEGFKPGRNTYELEAVFNANTNAVFGLNLLVGDGRKLPIQYDPRTAILCIDRTNCTDYTSNADFTKPFATRMYAPIETENGKLTLHLFVDQSSVEVFVNQGKEVLSVVTYPSPSQTGIELFSEKGATKLLSLKAWSLASIW
jgi:fructan beta-fructosidase